MKNEDYILTDNAINGIQLSEKIREDDMYEFSIIHRDSFIDELIHWISEATRDKDLMKADLKELMTWDDEYIFASNSTNHYIGKNSYDFNEVCKELLTINNNLL